MINIRYHIVSITAVFLALGIGAALGSTFLDRYTVNRIDSNVRSAEAKIRDTRARNADLTKDLALADARDERLIEDRPGVLFDGQLTDVPVLVFSSPGVDQELVSRLNTVLVSAGADLRGTLELRDQLRFDGDSVDATVSDEVDTTPSDVSGTSTAVYRRLRRALQIAGRPAPASEVPGFGTTTTTMTDGTVPVPDVSTTVPPSTLPPTTTPGETSTSLPDGSTGAIPSETIPEQPSILTALLASGYLRLTPGPGHTPQDLLLATPGYRYVLVTAAGLEPADTKAMLSLLPSGGSTDALPAVVVSARDPEVKTDDDAPLASVVSQVRQASALASRYDTVDDIDTLAGLAATVTVLRDMGTVPAGHYGQGPGATAILPPRP